MNKLIIEPIFAEWWRKSNLVVTSNQQREDVRQAFYVGIHCGLGLVGRANRMQPIVDAEKFIKDIMSEVDHVLKPQEVNGKIKFKGLIGGEEI